MKDTIPGSPPTVDEQIKALAETIYRDRIRRARATPLEQKVLSGAELFEMVYNRMAAGVRSQFPGSDDAEVLRIITRRLDYLERIRRQG